MNESPLANWTCVCGRHASIEHSVGGFCPSRDIIEKLSAERDFYKGQCEHLAKALEVISGTPNRFYQFAWDNLQAYRRAQEERK